MELKLEIPDRGKQIATDCLALISKKTSKKMTREEYYEGMLALEEKYQSIEPLSFRAAAEKYRAGWVGTWEHPKWLENELSKSRQYRMEVAAQRRIAREPGEDG